MLKMEVGTPVDLKRQKKQWPVQLKQAAPTNFKNENATSLQMLFIKTCGIVGVVAVLWAGM